MKYVIILEGDINSCYQCPCMVTDQEENYYCSLTDNSVEDVRIKRLDCPMIQLEDEEVLKEVQNETVFS